MYFMTEKGYLETNFHIWGGAIGIYPFSRKNSKSKLTIIALWLPIPKWKRVKIKNLAGISRVIHMALSYLDLLIKVARGESIENLLENSCRPIDLNDLANLPVLIFLLLSRLIIRENLCLIEK